MSVLLLFPDHNVFPAEGPTGAGAAPSARGWQGWRSLQDAEEGDRRGSSRSAGSAEGARPKISGAGEGSELQRGPARAAPAPGTAGEEPGAAGPERAGDGRGSLEQHGGVKAPRLRGWRGTERRCGRDSTGGTREGHGAPALALSPAGLGTSAAPHSARKWQRRAPERSARVPWGCVRCRVRKPRFCCPWNKAIT